MAKKKAFLSEFMRNRKEVGSVTPSSRFLVKKMLNPVDFTTAKVIVEFGPGEGVITRKILQRMLPDAQLFVFESNRLFCEAMRAEFKDERLHIIEGSAEQVEEVLNKHNFTEADVIISSLPYTVIPNDIVKNILDSAKKVLKPGGKYMQYQYSLQAHKRLKGLFEEVKLDFTPLNVPPAFVYICRKD